MTKQLRNLRPGTRFRSDGKTYTLLYANQCRARVQPEGERERKFTDSRDGTVKQFKAPLKAMNWAPEVEVEVLEG